MSVIETFLGNCRVNIAQTAKSVQRQAGCAAVLVAMQPAEPSMLRVRCPVLFAPLWSVDTKKIIETMFMMPEGTIVGVYR